MTSRKMVWLFAMVVCLSCSMTGCKTGTKIDNPFAKKPKLPSADTPAAIDGIQLSAPPEKYSKELTKNGDSSSGNLAQKGKYESESSGIVATAPQMAMNGNSGGAIPPYNAGSTITTQPVSASIPVASGSTMPSSSYPNSSYPVASQTTPNSYPTTSSPYPTMASNTNTPYPATVPYPTTAPAQYPPMQSPPAPYPTPYPTSSVQTTPEVVGSQYGTTSTVPASNQHYSAPGFSSEPVYQPTNSGYYAAPTTGFAPGSIGGGY